MRIWSFIKKIIKLTLKFIAALLLLIFILAMIGIYRCPLSVTPINIDAAPVATTLTITAHQQKIKDYARPSSSTYLIFPEWYIVYSSKEYATFIKTHPPSGFPYFASIEQFWCSYHAVFMLTKYYPFNMDDHIMLATIGVSLSAEYIVKGIYENSLGRLTEWLSSNESTDEDRYAQKVAQEYVDFIPTRPWFEFDFGNSLYGLWHDTSWYGPHMVRKWERKIILSMEYAVKAAYGWLIGLGSHAALGAASDYVYATINIAPLSIINNTTMKVISNIDHSLYIIAIPHEQPFTDDVKLLSTSNSSFIDIAGNHEIMITIIAPKDWQYDLPTGKMLFKMNILTDTSTRRIALQVPVTSLLSLLSQLDKKNVVLEHIYDF